MKQLLLLVVLSVFFMYCERRTDTHSTIESEDEVFPLVKEKSNKTEEISQAVFTIKEKLGKPFGTFIKLKVEILDGDSLHTKSGESTFLYKVISVDDEVLTEPVIMEFEDKTGKFPANDTEMHIYLEKMKNKELSKHQLNANIEMYVGSEYVIVAYETGEFSGLPYGGNYEFTLTPCGKGFHFRNYLVVLADLTKENSIKTSL